jgi:hypothetical protein
LILASGRQAQYTVTGGLQVAIVPGNVWSGE